MKVINETHYSTKQLQQLTSDLHEVGGLRLTN